MNTMAGLDDVGDVSARNPQPDSIAKAVKLMEAGAVLGAVQGVVSALYDVHRPAVAAVAVVSGVVAAGVWWLVARACRRGRGMGRVLASVFFGLATLGLVQTLSGAFHVRAANVVVDIVTWLVGFGAVVLLWQRDSGEYFQSRRRIPG